MRRTMLYFGSFNPVHRGHIALAEWVVGQGLCDELALVISPQSPYKEAADLAPELDRFEMAEAACRASRYPERIRPSVVEFLLPRPSYTIDTLRYLEQECGDRMRFSILMGGDQIERLDGWKEWERILEYPIYVYPRRGEPTMRFADRITLLDGAPLLDISSTAVRRALEAGEEVSQWIAPEGADHIRRRGLWSPERRLELLDRRLADTPRDADLLLERARLHYRRNAWGPALNDFNALLRLDPDHAEAREYARMIREILDFRYTDIYNP